MPTERPFLDEHIASRKAWGSYVAIKNELNRQDVRRMNASIAAVRQALDRRGRRLLH